MKSCSEVSPPNSLILLADSKSVNIPATMGDSIVAATTTCVAIGTLMEHDGKTRVLLTDECEAIERSGCTCVFQGHLKSRSRCVQVETIDGTSIVAIDVPTAEIKVEVWANDRLEPDLIQILVEPR